MSKKKKKRMYLLYDGSAILDTNSAMVLDTADSYEEAVETAPYHGQVCCYSYKEEGENLVDERLEFTTNEKGKVP